MLSIFDDDPAAQELLTEALEAPSVYDEFLRYLARHGHAVPVELLQRDVTLPHAFNAGAGAGVRRASTSTPTSTGRPTRPARSSSTWRRTSSSGGSGTSRPCERTIGIKRGTGGSSGVDFLRKALDLTFFPELYAVRTEIGTPR